MQHATCIGSTPWIAISRTNRNKTNVQNTTRRQQQHRIYNKKFCPRAASIIFGHADGRSVETSRRTSPSVFCASWCRKPVAQMTSRTTAWTDIIRSMGVVRDVICATGSRHRLAQKTLGDADLRTQAKA